MVLRSELAVFHLFTYLFLIKFSFIYLSAILNVHNFLNMGGLALALEEKLKQSFLGKC